MNPALQSFLADAAARTARGERVVAVFDADGTLWKGDIGDIFFAHQRHAGTLSAAPADGEELLELYEAEVTRDAAHGYGLMAQWNVGVAEEDLKTWIQECWASQKPSPVIPSQKKLIEELHRAGVEVWVVSASLWWLVAEGAKAFGIPPERVIGTRTRVEAGVLTHEWANQVPYRQGKANLVHSHIGIAPDLISGNSLGDYEMMLLARKLVLVISTAKPGDMYYGHEQELLAKAKTAPTAARWLIEGSK